MSKTPKDIVAELSATCAWIERCEFPGYDAAMDGLQRTCHDAIVEIERLLAGWTKVDDEFDRFVEDVILHRDKSPLYFDDGDEAAAIRYVRWLEAQVFPQEPTEGWQS